MKKHIAVCGICFVIAASGEIIGQQAWAQNADRFHPGDTVFPGSKEWIYAGSPRNSETGDSIILIWGVDSKLHRLGYEIEDADGSWVPNTLDNYEMVEAHRALAQLRTAVQQIAKEIPDKLLSFGASHEQVPKQSASDPYTDLIHWADSIAMCYGDPAFLIRVERYYRWPKSLNPWYTPLYIRREKS